MDQDARDNQVADLTLALTAFWAHLVNGFGVGILLPRSREDEFVHVHLHPTEAWRIVCCGDMRDAARVAIAVSSSGIRSVLPFTCNMTKPSRLGGPPLLTKDFDQ